MRIILWQGTIRAGSHEGIETDEIMGHSHQHSKGVWRMLVSRIGTIGVVAMVVPYDGRRKSGRKLPTVLIVFKFVFNNEIAMYISLNDLIKSLNRTSWPLARSQS